MAEAKTQKLGNPAVIGLAGFALTTLLLQIHNLGYMGVGPVLWLGFIYGGLVQLIAGLQEQKTGNNFGYSAFTSYGAFWISLALILMGNHFEVFKASTTDVGFFLGAWGLYTFMMCLGAIRIHTAMALTFISLFLGFMLLTIAHFGYPYMTKVAAIDLIFCAGCAWYMMMSIILKDVYNKDVLPMGKPWVKKFK